MTQVVDYQRPKRSPEQVKQEKAEQNKRTVTVVLTIEQINRIHEICGERGIKKSTVLREIVGIGLPIYDRDHGQA